MNPERSRLLFLLSGLMLIAVGVLLPESWYQPLHPLDSAPIISGWTLLRLSLIAEGIILVAVSVLKVRLPQTTPAQRLRVVSPPAPISPTTARWAMIALVVALIIGAVLRLYQLSSDLWLDEIVTLRTNRDLSLLQIYTTYINSNNHLLNSVLVNITVNLFGESEVTVRLPALLTGVLAIPVLYWAARHVLPPIPSAAAALMLAVSSQHVYFSQNARGYTAYMLFGLIAAVMLAKGLSEDRPRWWVAYIAAAGLCIAGHLSGMFVLAGHGVVAITALIVLASQGRDIRPMFARLIAVGIGLTSVAATLYIVIIPRALQVASTTYVLEGAGYQPLSLEFVTEMLRLVTTNANPLLLIAAVPAGLLGLIGAVSLMRRNWALLLALSAGPFIHMGYSAVRGLVYSPRFMLILIFPAILIALETFRIVGDWVAKRLSRETVNARRISGVVQIAGVIAVCAGFAFPLVNYYRYPKQPNRETLAYIQSIRQNDEAVFAIDLVDAGFRYYGTDRPEESGWVEGENMFIIRTIEQWDAANAAIGDRGVILVTTLERNMRLDEPALWERVIAGYTRLSKIPATVGDGDIWVWIENGAPIPEGAIVADSMP